MDVLSGFMSHREVASVKQLFGRTLLAHMAERCGCECFQIAADKTKSLIWGCRTLLDCDRQGKTEGLLPISLWPGGRESSLREEGGGTLRGDWPDLSPVVVAMGMGGERWELGRNNTALVVELMLLQDRCQTRQTPFLLDPQRPRDQVLIRLSFHSSH